MSLATLCVFNGFRILFSTPKLSTCITTIRAILDTRSRAYLNE
jgi:hypothetical protein